MLKKKKVRLFLEALEDRALPSTVALQGADYRFFWPHSAALTMSFVPDGTMANGHASDLFEALSRQADAKSWQAAIVQAAEAWASHIDMNIAVVADDGAPLGSPGAVQGDNRFGDIRVAAEPMGLNGPLAIGCPYNPLAGTYSGDIIFNSSFSFGPGAGAYDVYTVALHELGHVFGLPDENTDPSSVMYVNYQGASSGLDQHDIAVLQSSYASRLEAGPVSPGADLQTIASGSLAAGNSAATSSFLAPQTRLYHFVLDANSPATMHLVDAGGNLVDSLSCQAGSNASADLLLNAGVYTAHFVASGQNVTSYSLRGIALSDPLDPIPIAPGTGPGTTPDTIAPPIVIGPVAPPVSPPVTPTTTATASTYGQMTTLSTTVAGGDTGVPTGDVSFYDGTVLLGTVALDSTGTATLSTSMLALGSNSIMVAYSGDGVFQSGASSALNELNQGPTTTTLTTSASSSVYGQTVTLSAAVADSLTGAPTPTGTVTFELGTTVIGTGTLDSNGNARITTSAIPVGNQQLTAVYSGDGSFSATSAVSSQMVNQAPTTTTVVSNTGSSVLGQAVTFTATVAGAPGTPTGTVTFLSGSTILGTGTLDANGVATFSTSALPVGNCNVSVSYGGDSNFLMSTSTALSQTVTQPSTTTALSSSGPSTYGQAVTLTATVAAGTGTPTGSVTFFSGSMMLGTATLNANDVATFSTPALAAGSDNITATYSGDGTFAASSAAVVETVGQASTTTSVVSSPSSSVYGQLVTFTATVAAATGTPTGSVAFFFGGTMLGTGVLNANDVATFSTSALAAGSDNITASYSGDGTFAASSAAVVETVGQASTTTSVVSSASSSVCGQLVTFTATVAAGTGTPTGSVMFFSGGTMLGTGTLNANGVATFSTAALAAGNYNITASYSGNANLLASTSAAVSQTVNNSSTATMLTSNMNPAPVSQMVTLTAAVSGSGYGMPTGMVTFYDSATSIGMGTLNSSDMATFCTSSLTVGSHSLTAVYGGNANFAGSTSALLSQTVTAAAPMVSFVSPNGGPALGGTAVMIMGSNFVNVKSVYFGIAAATFTVVSPTQITAVAPSESNALAITGTTAVDICVTTVAGVSPKSAADHFTYSSAMASNVSGDIVYTPAQIRDAYGINNLALDGTGQTIAIVDAYDDPTVIQAVDTFDMQFSATDGGPTLYQQYGPGSSFLTVLNQGGQAGSLPYEDPTGDWAIETALDVEWAHAVAPGANIVLVECNSQDLGDLMTGVATAANLPGVSVVSMSWGLPEGSAVLQADEAQYDGYFATPLGHEGVTYLASTGDFGSTDLEYPAVSPNVVAVGGTSLYVNADNSYNNETGWGYALDSGVFIGSGGGVSQFEAQPGYQMGVQSTGYRTVPDVSSVADPATGVWVADPSGSDSPWLTVGGTSLASPCWAGLVAMINQGRTAAGEATLNSLSNNATQQALYSLPAGDFHDISSGSNGSFSAGSGYNMVTGLGSPLADALVADMISYQETPSPNMVPPVYESGTALGPSANADAVQPFVLESMTWGGEPANLAERVHNGASKPDLNADGPVKVPDNASAAAPALLSASPTLVVTNMSAGSYVQMVISRTSVAWDNSGVTAMTSAPGQSLHPVFNVSAITASPAGADDLSETQPIQLPNCQLQQRESCRIPVLDLSGFDDVLSPAGTLTASLGNASQLRGQVTEQDTAELRTMALASRDDVLFAKLALALVGSASASLTGRRRDGDTERRRTDRRLALSV